MDVTSASDFQEEKLEKIVITNSNQELPVTYLFYELERRVGISEKLHRVTPVILVANEVPARTRSIKIS